MHFARAPTDVRHLCHLDGDACYRELGSRMDAAMNSMRSRRDCTSMCTLMTTFTRTAIIIYPVRGSLWPPVA